MIFEDMGNYGISINLQALRGACLRTLKGKDGQPVRCAIIPVEMNREIFVGEKGTYRSLTAIETRETGKYGDTHLLKGNLPEEVYKAMGEEERRSQPILGQMRPLARREQPAPAAEVISSADDDDLPF